MFVLYKHKNNKLGILSWPLEELMLETKQVESFKQDRQTRTMSEEFQFSGFVNSIHEFVTYYVLYLLECWAMKHS